MGTSTGKQSVFTRISRLLEDLSVGLESHARTWSLGLAKLATMSIFHGRVNFASGQGRLRVAFAISSTSKFECPSRLSSSKTELQIACPAGQSPKQASMPRSPSPYGQRDRPDRRRYDDRDDDRAPRYPDGRDGRGEGSSGRRRRDERDDRERARERRGRSRSRSRSPAPRQRSRSPRSRSRSRSRDRSSRHHRDRRRSRSSSSSSSSGEDDRQRKKHRHRRDRSRDKESKEERRERKRLKKKRKEEVRRGRMCHAAVSAECASRTTEEGQEGEQVGQGRYRRVRQVRHHLRDRHLHQGRRVQVRSPLSPQPVMAAKLISGRIGPGSSKRRCSIRRRSRRPRAKSCSGRSWKTSTPAPCPMKSSTLSKLTNVACPSRRARLQLHFTG